MLSSAARLRQEDTHSVGQSSYPALFYTGLVEDIPKLECTMRPSVSHTQRIDTTWVRKVEQERVVSDPRSKAGRTCSHLFTFIACVHTSTPFIPDRNGLVLPCVEGTIRWPEIRKLTSGGCRAGGATDFRAP